MCNWDIVHIQAPCGRELWAVAPSKDAGYAKLSLCNSRLVLISYIMTVCKACSFTASNASCPQAMYDIKLISAPPQLVEDVMQQARLKEARRQLRASSQQMGRQGQGWDGGRHNINLYSPKV